MGFTRDELASYRGATIPDLVGPGLRLLFVGINPGLWTAATQTPFAHPGNRFYPALVAAGILPELPDFVTGFTADDRARFVSLGLGISNLVNRATARADELSRDELRAGADRLRSNVAALATARRRHRGHHRVPRRSRSRRRCRASRTSNSRAPSSGCSRTRADSTPTTRSRRWPRRTPSRRGPRGSRLAQRRDDVLHDRLERCAR